MVAGRKKPTFNLKVVVQETGIKPDTIRAWERRYGLPQPERTPGGHRLYSQYDIEALKWLVERQHEGLSISRAVDLWRTIKEEGHEPLDEVPLPVGVTADQAASSRLSDAVLAELRGAWTEACMRFDGQRAEAVVTQALARFPVEVVCTELLQRGVAEIGERWYDGEASVQQEHFASELAIRRIETLVTLTPAPTRPGRIVVACPPEEQHSFGLLVTTLLLRRQGWDVLYLGASVPVGRLAETIRTTRPRLVVMAAQQLYSAAMLREAGRIVVGEGAQLAFGGRVFKRLPALVDLIPGVYMGDAIDRAPHVVAELMTSPTSPRAIRPLPAEYVQALEEYRAKQTYIEATVWRTLESGGVPPAQIEQANKSLSENITAALMLGHIDLARTEIAWVEGLIAKRDIHRGVLQDYLEHYRHATAEHMAHGELIAAMLTELAEEAV